MLFLIFFIYLVRGAFDDATVAVDGWDPSHRRPLIGGKSLHRPHALSDDQNHTPSATNSPPPLSGFKQVQTDPGGYIRGTTQTDICRIRSVGWRCMAAVEVWREKSWKVLGMINEFPLGELIHG